MEQVEKDLRGKFPALNNYFDAVFDWLGKEASAQPEIIAEVCKRKKASAVSVYYAFVFLQVDEQIKYELTQQPGSRQADEQLYSLWTYLLDKLESYHYLPESDLADRRAEMAELIKKNG